jgi:penicillin-insensitive murein DD-endopeptidase
MRWLTATQNPSGSPSLPNTRTAEGSELASAGRFFVHPAIKKVLCEQAGTDCAWLAKVRPWRNHYYHFHVRLTCPPGAEACEGQTP